MNVTTASDSNAPNATKRGVLGEYFRLMAEVPKEAKDGDGAGLNSAAREALAGRAVGPLVAWSVRYVALLESYSGGAVRCWPVWVEKEGAANIVVAVGVVVVAIRCCGRGAACRGGRVTNDARQ